MRCSHCRSEGVDVEHVRACEGSEPSPAQVVPADDPTVASSSSDRELPDPRVMHLPPVDAEESPYGRQRWVGEEWALIGRVAEGLGADVQGMDADGDAAWLREIEGELGEEAVLLVWREEPDLQRDDE